MLDKVQAIVNGYGLGISKENLVSEVYWKLNAMGVEATIINEKYIEVAGVSYQFIKSKKNQKWIVKGF